MVIIDSVLQLVTTGFFPRILDCENSGTSSHAGSKRTLASISEIMIILGALVIPIDYVMSEPSPEKALVRALLEGGYNLYFRHEATDWSQPDNVRIANDWLRCDGSRIRQLSKAGRKRAVSTGDAMQSLGIPVGRILASPYCRTVETARLMNLGPVTTTTEIINLRVAEYFGGQSVIVASARALLATLPETDTNTVIVAHGNVAREATPVYPEEGEAVVFQPDGKGDFRYIGRLTAEDWVHLKQAAVRQ